MIFEGPGIVRRIIHGLSRLLDRDGLTSIDQAVGTETDRWANQRN
jgi:dihydroorotate dehydrogenase